jgi:transcription initiation factor IIF auxiliary subunit
VIIAHLTSLDPANRIAFYTYSQGKDSGVEGFPLRAWSIELYVLNENGEQVSANLFDKVVYRLHPSFGERANQSMSRKPKKKKREGELG